MRKTFVTILFCIIFLSVNSSISAHPGNTAADGCHYCRTNCDKWGVALDERHCHGGAPAVQQVETVREEPVFIPPTNIPTPTLRPTRKPTKIPTKKPTIIKRKPTIKIQKNKETKKKNLQKIKQKNESK